MSVPVSLTDITLTYGGDGGVKALEGLSLDVAPGEFAAVVGPSGCGKSTLMKLATGLHRAQAGSCKVNGEEVTKPLKIAGMAFQNPVMLPWRKTIDNVLIPMEVVEPHRKRIRFNRAEYREKAEALLATVGLAGFGDRYPWQLSGGMQQRASLCRALIHEPDLLMLDEPFGALDAFTREELWCVLRDLYEARRFTCILVTHDLREAVFLADKVHVLSNRPARVIDTLDVPFERPRDIAITYDPQFAEIVGHLRSEIADARAQPAAAVEAA